MHGNQFLISHYKLNIFPKKLELHVAGKKLWLVIKRQKLLVHYHNLFILKLAVFAQLTTFKEIGDLKRFTTGVKVQLF